ncbi:hypothetical protein AB838_14320 [Rhodobacteraceae bacterium (ex Bugula neritina AB1)]|nr:hypothetical protein AB838_14320 [Rhodobacteraceae bacterium (ex Bugula neritina AB1)]
MATFTGTSGNDFLQGGSAIDVFFATSGGSDTIDGGNPENTVLFHHPNSSGAYDNGVNISASQSGSDYSASAVGGSATVEISNVTSFYLTNGNDSIFANEDSNNIFGFGGDDAISAGAGNDFVNGGAGNDSFIGGAGNDVLTGGSGNDTFIFGSGDGQDTVQDFTSGEDLISFLFSPVSSFADLEINQSGNNAVIEYGDSSITLIDVQSSTLDASDFTFFG